MPATEQRQPSASMRPIPASGFTESGARHLLLRAGFGAMPDQPRTLSRWGIERSVDFLLDTGSIPYEHEDDGSFADDIIVPLSRGQQRELRNARQTGDEDTVARFRSRRQAAQRRDRKQMAAIQRWWLARLIETPKPLEEKMTLFWHGHFVSGYRAVENSQHLLMQNNLFRTHALGNFADLLHAIIRDPAMLGYLDNKRSRKQAPNENLARELLELFSLGVGGYQEEDIKEGARALTGYSYEGNSFDFKRNQHDPGTKTIFGVRGSFDGDGFVDAILAQRTCAEFICWKLYRFFVADIPPDFSRTPPHAQRVIRAMAATMRRERYAIKPALRELFLSEHFHDPAIACSKIKSPAEVVVGAIRSMHTPTRSLGKLLDAMDLMGQDLFHPPNVAGWAGGRAWINTSTLFARQNTLVYLLAGITPRSEKKRKKNKSAFKAKALFDRLNAPEGDHEQTALLLLDHLLGAAALEVRESRVRDVATILGSGGGNSRAEALALVTALPEYQLC